MPEGDLDDSNPAMRNVRVPPRIDRAEDMHTVCISPRKCPGAGKTETGTWKLSNCLLNSNLGLIYGQAAVVLPRSGAANKWKKQQNLLALPSGPVSGRFTPGNH